VFFDEGRIGHKSYRQRKSYEKFRDECLSWWSDNVRIEHSNATTGRDALTTYGSARSRFESVSALFKPGTASPECGTRIARPVRGHQQRSISMMGQARIAVAAAALCVTVFEGPAAAQTAIEQGRGMVWGDLAFQSDVGGSLNSSGIGVVSSLRAEINSNTWGERYDASLLMRVGGAYNLTDRSQLFGTINWEQAEADGATVGLLGAQPLDADFSDYQGWGIDVGYRWLFPLNRGPLPFVSGSLGFQRLQNITVTLSSATGFRAEEVPFYDDSWVTSWRLGTGFLWDFNQRFGAQVTLDFKYSGVLSDQTGIGTIGFERINDTGNRWTLPLMGGVYVKF
jgi:hypothetical protein